MTTLHALAHRAAVLLLLFPLGACALASVADGPPPQLFTLTAAHPEPSGRAASGAQIIVDEFSAPAVIDTGRIVQQSSPNELKYYAGARWADRAPRLIRNLMVESLENSGRFSSVSARDADLRGDYELTGDIRQFAVDASDASNLNVKIEFYVRLVRDDERTIVAAKSFSGTAPVAGSGMTPIVAAYDAGLRRLFEDIAVWADESARTAPSKTAAK